MKRRTLGRTGISVSEICLGTMTFGSMADEATAVACLDEAFEAGVDFIDIAEIYPVPPDGKWVGASEEICGRWLATKPRDAVIVATKVAGPQGGWFRGPVRNGKTSLDRHHIERAVEGSLRRLQTDYIDLYQTHWPDPETPLEVTLEALDRLVEQGKVRAVGCSNQDAHGLMKSLWLSDRDGLVRYETIQNNFSILQRSFERGLAKVCREEQVGLLPYSPIAGGVLSGKYLDDAWPTGARFSRYREGDARTRTMTKRFINERTLETTRRIGAIAAEHDLSPVTFSIAWTLSKDFVASTIIGVTSLAQLGDHLAASDVTLPSEAIDAVDALSSEIRNPME